MLRNYEQDVAAYRHNYQPIFVNPQTESRLENLVAQVVATKATEPHHQKDPRKEAKRFMTGFMGEAALEQLLGISIIDWTVGDSSHYHKPDIPGYRIGIKTVERGKYPIIFKHNTYPQIICVKNLDVPHLVYVCGIASPEVLNRYQDDSLILSPYLRARGTKTGFYGFNQLIPLRSLADLLPYKDGGR